MNFKSSNLVSINNLNSTHLHLHLLKWLGYTISDVTLQEIFGKSKPVIGMVHLWIPSPSYRVEEPKLSFFDFISNVRKDIDALQIGGADGLLFVNESDKPVRSQVDYDVYAWFSLVIGSIINFARVPFGIEVLDDQIAGLNLASIFGASFVRGSFLEQTSISKDANKANYKKWNSSQLGRIQLGVYGNLNSKKFHDMDSEIGKEKLPDHVSGISLSDFDVSAVERVYSEFKSLNPTKDLVLGSGVNHENAKILNNCSDGMIVGSSFKRNGLITNEVEANRVKELIASTRN